MRGLLVVTTVVAALIVGTLAARPVHAEGPGTTDRPALAEVVFAGAPWRRSAACWSHTMSIRVVARPGERPFQRRSHGVGNGRAVPSERRPGIGPATRRTGAPAGCLSPCPGRRLLAQRLRGRTEVHLQRRASLAEARRGGDVYWQGKVRRFYLEWDRGTMRWPEMVEKLRVYAAFFAKARRDGTEEGSLPEVLFVTTSPMREAVAWRCLDDAFSDIGQAPSRFRTSVHTLVCGAGPLGEVWRTFGSTRRSFWLPGGGR